MINWKFRTRHLQPIGLDIGHNSIKMIQLAIDEGQITVHAAQKAPIDPNLKADGEEKRRFIVLTIKQMLNEDNFRGRDVVSTLPNDSLRITSLRLAETDVVQNEQTLLNEAAHRFGLDPNKDSIKYLLAGNVRQDDEIKTELIIFGTDNETIKTHIGILEETGLKPAGIDTVPCALFRNFERLMRRQEDKEHTVVFIDVGDAFTTVVFGRGGKICFVKQMPIGGEQFNQKVAAKLGISVSEAEILRVKLQTEAFNNSERQAYPHGSPQSETETQLDASIRQTIIDALSSVAEEMAREISLCFRYYTVTFRGKRIERAFLTGGGAYESILLDVLRRQLAVEIEVAEPLRGFDLKNLNLNSDSRGIFCEWAVAVGLSLSGWNGAPMKTVVPKEVIGHT